MNLLGKGKWRFQRTKITESTDALVNPGCGWCRIFTFFLDKQIDFDELYWCLQKQETLVQAVIVIGAFRRQEITEIALVQLHKLLQFFREHEKEMILRFTYDQIGQGLLAEPDELRWILTHMEQIGPVLRRYADDILLLQGLFIGSWGEMHSSRYLSKEKLRQLLQTLRKAVGDQIPIAVRTPLQWRLLHKHGTVPGSTNVCIFNDGMFGSESDLGTYGVKKRREADWEESWCRADELAFLQEIHKCLPYGGEAVGNAAEGGLKQAAAQMRQSHLCYLNAVHDKKRLDLWRNETWQEKGIWKGASGLDYIGAHLGYRPVVCKVSGRVQNDLHLKIRLELEIEIENTGFAGMLEEAELAVTAETEGREPRTQLFLLRQEDFMPGVPCRLVCQFAKEIESGEYRIYLRMHRKRDQRRIFIANGQEHDKVFLGSFLNL